MANFQTPSVISVEAETGRWAANGRAEKLEPASSLALVSTRGSLHSESWPGVPWSPLMGSGVSAQKLKVDPFVRRGQMGQGSCRKENVCEGRGLNNTQTSCESTPHKSESASNMAQA